MILISLIYCGKKFDLLWDRASAGAYTTMAMYKTWKKC